MKSRLIDSALVTAPAMPRAARIMILAAAVLALAGDQARSAQESEFINGKWVIVQPPPAGTPTGDLAVIRKLVADDEAGYAVAEAKKFLRKYPDEPAREEVMNLAGLAEFNAGRYFQAFEWYKRQWDEFPSGRLSERALQKEMEIAEAFLGGKKRVVAGVVPLPARSEGQDILNRIVEQAPGSVIAETAMIRLAADHEDHKEYPEAAAAYDRFLQLFPKSAKFKDVTLSAANATYLSYRGRQYDITPLIEAQQRYKTFNQLYPQSATANNVPAILSAINSQRAEAEFASAELYERTGQPAAAAYYYKLVRDQYQDTQWAAKADLSIKRLGNVSPPQPPKARPSTAPVVPAASEPAMPAPPEATNVPTMSQPASLPSSLPTGEEKAPVQEPRELEELAPSTQETTTNESNP